MRAPVVLLALALASCSANTASEGANCGKSAKTPVADAATDQPASVMRPPQAPKPDTTEATAASPITWPAPFTPAGSCTRTAARAASIWMRPASGANQFGQLTAGDRVQLAARTADGWVGFSPGSAQAANVGIFRLRWVRAAEAFAPGDSCTQLPLVVAPPAGCLLMAVRAVPVRRQPAGGAALLSTIPDGSYAQAAVGDAAQKGSWVAIVVPGQPTPGYVSVADANFSGSCQ